MRPAFFYEAVDARDGLGLAHVVDPDPGYL
jgi:hypothetical protein